VIAVDTSALIAIARREALGPACLEAIENDREAVVSAGTVAEALVVATVRGYRPLVQGLLDYLPLHIDPVSPAAAQRIGDVYQRWGKGMHAAGLNYGDCFAYELAERNGCPLLFIGDDFAKTDIASALQRSS
jgi:ribonuclease VapC